MKKTQIARFGYFRLAVASVEHRIADLEFNAEQIASAALRAKKQGCHCVVFPELSLTGYGCGDLFFQSILLERTRQVLGELKNLTRHEQMILIVGAPIAQGGRLFNCAVVISGGEILVWCRKTFCPIPRNFTRNAGFRRLTIGPPTRSRCAAKWCRLVTICCFARTNCRVVSLAWRSAKTAGWPIRPVARWPWPEQRCWLTCLPVPKFSASRRTAASWCSRNRHVVWRPMPMRPPARANRAPTWCSPVIL